MRKRALLAAVASAALTAGAANVAKAATVLTFEGLQNFEPIGSYYDGGTGGLGSGPGPNYGITFGSDSLAIISGCCGGSGNFSGAPSMPTVAFFLGGPGDVMDVPAGFTTGFSFFYSAVVYPGDVSVWSGVDGTGTELADISLPVTPSGGTGCTYGSYCPFLPAGVAFSGTAESAVFSGTANYIAFDNITLGSADPIGAPEPATLALLGTGMAGVGLLRRRRKST
jgi:PEP-CTERM motif